MLLESRLVPNTRPHLGMLRRRHHVASRSHVRQILRVVTPIEGAGGNLGGDQRTRQRIAPAARREVVWILLHLYLHLRWLLVGACAKPVAGEHVELYGVGFGVVWAEQR